MTAHLTEYLLNALWQTPLVLLAAMLAAWIARRLHPRVVHRIWVCALLCAVIVPACRFDDVPAWLHTPGAHAANGLVRVTIGAGSANVPAVRVAHMLELALLCLFAIGLLCGVIRLVRATLRIRQLWAESTPLPPRLAGLCDGLSRKVSALSPMLHVELRTSPAVAGPAVIGGHTILLPHAFLQDATDAEMEAALAHELAHVQRRDLMKNLVYQVVAMPLLWHPCTWLLRRGIDDTREMVCDAVAADALGAGKAYARSLLSIAARLPAVLHGTATASVGMFRNNTLERRITMLMQNPKPLGGPTRLLIASTLLGVALVSGAALASTHVSLDADHVSLAADPATEQDGKALTVPAGVMAGTVESRVAPVYPPDAKKDHLEGTVILKAIIGKDGVPGKLMVASSPGREFSKSAIDAVKQWRWKPYLLNGQPTEVSTNVSINYSMTK